LFPSCITVRTLVHPNEFLFIDLNRNDIGSCTSNTRWTIIVWTNNGDALLVGEKLGADVTAGTIQTGAGLGDLYGYSVTFTGMEQLPAAFLSGSSTTSALGGLTANYTVVYGSNS
jgi:hypothetical protein